MKDTEVTEFVRRHEYISIIDDNWGTFYVKHPKTHISDLECSSIEIRGIILVIGVPPTEVHEIVIGGAIGVVGNTQHIHSITKKEFNRLLNQFIIEANE